MKTLYWLRNDLRTHDNQCFNWLSSNAEQVLFLYCMPAALQRPSKRRIFQLESLLELQETLRVYGHDILVTNTTANIAIPQLCEEHRIDSLIYSEECTNEEIREEFFIRDVARKNILVHSFFQGTLLDFIYLPFTIETLPDTYKDFQTLVEKSLKIAEPLPKPQKIPAPISWQVSQEDIGHINLADELGRQSSDKTKGGECQGLRHLEEFIWEKDLLRVYKNTRHDFTNFESHCRLSAWLANGCLSPRLIYKNILEYQEARVANDSTYALFQELLIRDYFKFFALKHGPLIFSHGNRERQFECKNPEQAFKNWQEGRTGIPFIDANMRELKQTGFMPSLGRELVAGYLAKVLQVPWQWGANYFSEALIDYDAASNWGNWNYVSDMSKETSSTLEDILQQAYSCDPCGDYVRRWVPELQEYLDKEIHEPWKNKDKLARCNYPATIFPRAT